MENIIGFSGFVLSIIAMLIGILYILSFSYGKRFRGKSFLQVVLSDFRFLMYQLILCVSAFISSIIGVSNSPKIFAIIGLIISIIGLILIVAVVAYMIAFARSTRH